MRTNDGVGSATAATLRKLATIFTITPTSAGRASSRAQISSGVRRYWGSRGRSPSRTTLLLAACTALAASPAKAAPIPMDQIGAVAGKQYQGDGLSVAATPEGARLRCVFQKLEGQATPEGLWLTSTAAAANSERFRVVASAVGRKQSSVRSDMGIVRIPQPDQAPSGAALADGAASWRNMPLLTELETTLLDLP
jgi:hypothetical protein